MIFTIWLKFSTHAHSCLQQKRSQHSSNSINYLYPNVIKYFAKHYGSNSIFNNRAAFCRTLSMAQAIHYNICSRKSCLNPANKLVDRVSNSSCLRIKIRKKSARNQNRDGDEKRKAKWRKIRKGRGSQKERKRRENWRSIQKRSIKFTLHLKQVDFSNPNFQLFWLRVFIPHTKKYICTPHRSPNSNNHQLYFDHVFKFIEAMTLPSTRSEIIVLDDFNVHDSD